MRAICIGLLGLGLAAAPLLLHADDDDETFELTFVNTTDVTATVSVDGKQVCVLDAGEDCSTSIDVDFLDGDDDHPVHVEMGDQYVDSVVHIDECVSPEHFTITDDALEHSCEKAAGADPSRHRR